MTTYVNLTAPVTRDDVFAAISDAQDIGDRVVVALNGICSRAEDWLSSKVIYGNYGDIVVAQTGEVLLYEPSEDARDDPAGAYHDIVHVEIDKWRHRHGFTWSEVGRSIDILMVAFHTESGLYEPAIGFDGCHIEEGA